MNNAIKLNISLDSLYIKEFSTLPEDVQEQILDIAEKNKCTVDKVYRKDTYFFYFDGRKNEHHFLYDLAYNYDIEIV